MHRSLVLDGATSECEQITLVPEGEGLPQRSLSSP